MARLVKEMGLSDSLINKLKDNKILTVLDFLQEDAEKLSSVCNATFKEILDVRYSLVLSGAAAALNGVSAYESMMRHSAILSSGITRLDEVLGGGFLTGRVYEVCGLSGEGKTQLCLTVTAHVASVIRQRIHYIDTMGHIRADRIHSIIKHKHITEEEIAEFLKRIKVTQVSEMYDLIRYLHHLRQSLTEDEAVTPRLVIIDSVTSLYLPFMASDNTQGFSLLNQAMSLMKALATDYHIVFLVVNLASTFYETETVVDEGEGENEIRPMLGRYWLHAPHTRLLISRHTSEAAQRVVRVIKSTELPLGASCVLTVSHNGLE